jgi:hypothetical protein
MWLLLLALACDEGSRGNEPAISLSGEKGGRRGIEMAEGAPAGTEAQRALLKRVIQRDPEATCDELEGLSPQIVQDLGWISTSVVSPGYAPQRAVTCLLEKHRQDGKPVFLQWMADPSRLGAALRVSSILGELPAADAVELARAGLAGPHGPRLSHNLSKCPHPEVSALVNAPETPNAPAPDPAAGQR